MLQTELAKKGFEEHQVVTNVLDMHVKQNAVMQSNFEDQMKSMREENARLRVDVEKALKVANQAISKVGKL